MKMKLSFIPIVSFLMIVFGFVLLTSSTNITQLYKKCVFPIIYNVDNAFATTELNGHVRGDSATGYEIWGRNHSGTEFPLGSGYQKELFTDQTNFSVGDTMVNTVNSIIIKKINSPSNISFNALEFSAGLGSSATAMVVVCVLDSSLVVLTSDTIVYTVPGSNPSIQTYNKKMHTRVKLKANKDYYVGIFSAGDFFFIGHHYNINTRPLTTNNIQWQRKSISNAPAVGSTISGLSKIFYTLNLHFTTNL